MGNSSSNKSLDDVRNNELGSKNGIEFSDASSSSPSKMRSISPISKMNRSSDATPVMMAKVNKDNLDESKMSIDQAKGGFEIQPRTYDQEEEKRKEVEFLVPTIKFHRALSWKHFRRATRGPTRIC